MTKAIAPYNFVSLNESVLFYSEIKELAKELKGISEEINEKHSGTIEIEAEVKEPFFIRGPVTMKDGSWETLESRIRSEPFLDKYGKPIIPGSSLRGMIRNLFEIFTFSKIKPVSDKNLYFRDIRNREEYTPFFTERFGYNNEQKCNIFRTKVRAGILTQDEKGWVIKEYRWGRIEERNIPSNIRNFSIPQLQTQKLWFEADGEEKNHFFRKKFNRRGKRIHPDLYLRFEQVTRVSETKEDGLERGILVKTGPMPNKHMASVFFIDRKVLNVFDVSESMLKEFEDENQITSFQAETFNKDEPELNSRSKNGGIRNNEPVFFITKKVKGKVEVKFFGRAIMFRLPYNITPGECVYDDHKKNEPDMAEKLFGIISETGKQIKSRVFFENLFSVGNFEIGNEIVPSILSSPKPTTYQHYLQQKEGASVRSLKKYFRKNNPRIRGHKLFWHKKQQTKESKRLIPEIKSGRDTQHTIFKPVIKGKFKGFIKFESVSLFELGALLFSLDLPEGYAHKIGSGKPHGFGSIRLKIKALNIIDKSERFKSWSGNAIKNPLNINDAKLAFEKLIQTFATKSKVENIDIKTKGIAAIPRLKELLKMLDYQNCPSTNNTRYMVFENGDKKRFPSSRGNEFEKRFVLPKPTKV